MGPDDESPIVPCQVLFGPSGATLPEMKPLGVIAEGLSALGEAAEDAGEKLYSFAEALKPVTFTVQMNYRASALVTKLFFGSRLPKRTRRTYDAMMLRARKAERDEYRAAQRRAIGITKEKP